MAVSDKYLIYSRGLNPDVIDRVRKELEAAATASERRTA
jgi:hypothetical protein